MSRAKIIDYYMQKLDDPGFEIIQVRRELKQGGIPDEEISVIFRILDNEMQRRLVRKQQRSQATGMIVMGVIIFTLSLFLTVGTYLGIISMGNHFIVMYGPMGFGLAMLFYGLAKR